MIIYECCCFLLQQQCGKPINLKDHINLDVNCAAAVAAAVAVAVAAAAAVARLQQCLSNFSGLCLDGAAAAAAVVAHLIKRRELHY